MKKLLFAGLAMVFLMVGLTSTSNASPITLSSVRTMTLQHTGFSVDATTGKYYQSTGINGEATVKVYDNTTDFSSDTVSSTISLAGGGFYGTYFTVNDGNIFGHSWLTGTGSAKWDASTGSREVEVSSISNMGGVYPFNWGGHTTVNFLQDNTGMYIFGTNSTGNIWLINQVDNNMNILSTKSFAANTLGYAFMLNGNLLMSNSYDSNHITNSFNFAGNTLSAVDFTLTGGLSAYPYWDNTFYDSSIDTLYFHNAIQGLSSVANASDVFGVPVSSNPVPVPATMLLFGSGIVSLAGTRLRRKK